MHCIGQGNGYSSHTPEEWRYTNEQEIIAAEKKQESAQRLILEADRLMEQTKDKVLKNELEIDHRSKAKIKDVEFKRNEIERQKRYVEEEIELLLGYQMCIEKFSNNFSNDALDAIAECLRHR